MVPEIRVEKHSFVFGGLSHVKKLLHISPPLDSLDSRRLIDLTRLLHLGWLGRVGEGMDGFDGIRLEQSVKCK